MKTVIYFIAFAALVVSIQSCGNTSKVSPKEQEGMMKPDVGEGKVIFMRDCVRCHEQKKVENYTAAQWNNILPRMIVKAQLDETQSRQVKAYVEWKMENE